MSEATILLENVADGVQLLTLNRPRALNALNETLLDELEQTLDRLQADGQLRVLLITGAGDKAFVAGADIRAMQMLSPDQALQFAQQGQRVLRKLEQLPCPVIALVNGFALGGGCELALACDLILASDNARFGQPEVRLGITAGFGGSQRLPRRIGPAMALELLLSGRQMKADEAHQCGLVNHVYPADSLREEGLELAASIATCGPQAVRQSKQLVHQGLQVDMERGCALEAQAFGLCFARPEQREGMTAFIENRPADFSQR